MPAARKDTDVVADGFSTWDSMVADAQSLMEPIKPFQLPLGDVVIDGETIQDVTLTVPCPDGVNYLAIVAAQRVGNAPAILDGLFPDPADRRLVIAKMSGVPYPIVDVLSGRILRHYYGLSAETEEKAGNSPSS